MARNKARPDRFERGDRVHDWLLEAPLGEGGSSEVWSVRDDGGEQFALKILISRELSKIIRFVREVELMDSIQERISIPLYDVYLPGCSEPPACYSMPVATSLRTYLKTSRVDAGERVRILVRIGECLDRLHALDLFHCDVKPGNIYTLADRWVFGDFGLAIRSNQRLLAGPDELPGTREYTAPELYAHHLPRDTDWAKCDSFSFGKTIWTVMTDRRRPPGGPHRRNDPETSLKRIVGNRPGVRELDSLVRAAVAGHPAHRPSIGEITDRLRQWLETYDSAPDASGIFTDAELVPTIAAD